MMTKRNTVALISVVSLLLIVGVAYALRKADEGNANAPESKNPSASVNSSNSFANVITSTESTPPLTSKERPSATAPGEKSNEKGTSAPAMDRSEIAKLMSDASPEAQTKILDYHASASEIDRRHIERQAKSGNLKLKTAMVSRATTDLSSNDPKAAGNALDTLRNLVDPSGEQQAVNLLKTSTDATVSQKSIEYLGRISSKSSFDAVFAIASTAETKELKAVAIRNLSLCGAKDHPDRVLPLLESVLKDNDPKMQFEALRVLGRFPDRITPDIKKRLQEMAAGDQGKDPAAGQVRESANELLEILSQYQHFDAEHANN